MASVKYVCASRDNSCLLQAYGFDDAANKLRETGIEVSLEIRSEPRKSLAETYNAILNADDAGKFDWIVFIHSDAAVNVEAFTNKLIEFTNKYDAIGVAGAKKLNLSATPLSWFTASKETPESRIGMVTHVGPVGVKRANMATVYTQPESAVKDDYVAAIDGVCIAVGRKVIENGECRFDEKFPFDFYDLDFSLTVNTHGLTLGVVADESFVHLSAGRGILKPEYLTIESTFRNKWMP